jgi:hypothetical protein
MTEVAALVGDFYHTSEPMQDSLQQAASRIGVQLKVFTDRSRLPWDSLGDFRGLIIVKENRIVSGASCFTPGHTAEVLSDPGYRRFLENGLRWALRAEKS